MDETAITTKPRGGMALALALTFGLLALGGVALGTRSWIPALASRHGAGIDHMLIYLLITTGALFLAGHVVLVYSILRFGRQPRITWRLGGPRIERRLSLALGLLMTAVAEGGVLAIGLPVFREYFVAQAPADAVRIEVTAQQFAWNVRYPGPDGVFGRTDPARVETANPLGIDPADPAGRDDLVDMNNFYFAKDRPVKIRLRARDVIHSFFLPNFRVKQDAVPGMAIDIWFVPTQEGDFELACAELCGLGHYQMKGLVHVVSSAELERILADKARQKS